jgi:hypothetical protein
LLLRQLAGEPEAWHQKLLTFFFSKLFLFLIKEFSRKFEMYAVNNLSLFLMAMFFSVFATEHKKQTAELSRPVELDLILSAGGLHTCFLNSSRLVCWCEKEFRVEAGIHAQLQQPIN